MGLSIEQRFPIAASLSVAYPLLSLTYSNHPQLKLEVSKVIGAEGKYLRLIAAGKMLSPEESIVKQFGLSENCCVHCVVTAAPPRLRLPSLTPVEQAEEEVNIFFSFRVRERVRVRKNTSLGLPLASILVFVEEIELRQTHGVLVLYMRAVNAPMCF